MLLLLKLSSLILLFLLGIVLQLWFENKTLSISWRRTMYSSLFFAYLLLSLWSINCSALLSPCHRSWCWFGKKSIQEKLAFSWQPGRGRLLLCFGFGVDVSGGVGEGVGDLHTCPWLCTCYICNVSNDETLFSIVSRQKTFKCFTDPHLWNLGFLSSTNTDRWGPSGRYVPTCIASSVPYLYLTSFA